MTCAGCGAELTPSPYNRPRKWCSNRCRKQTLYSTPCVDCGAPVNGSNGLGAHQRCASCNGRRAGELNRQRALPTRELIERLWAEGKTAREIAAAVGWTAKNPNTLLSIRRSRGYDLPHRRTPEQLARITAGADESMAKARAKAAEMRAAA